MNILCLPIEIRRWIEGYEGLYSISNLGNIKSETKKVLQFIRGYSYITYRGQPIKSVMRSSGYYHITLCKDGTRRQISIHRLMAETFIPNPDNKPQVNHIDGDRTNNKLSNLEWTTCKENTLHGRYVLKRGNYSKKRLLKFELGLEKYK